jgi:hypothetical protein
MSDKMSQRSTASGEAAGHDSISYSEVASKTGVVLGRGTLGYVPEGPDEAARLLDELSRAAAEARTNNPQMSETAEKAWGAAFQAMEQMIRQIDSVSQATYDDVVSMLVRLYKEARPVFDAIVAVLDSPVTSKAAMSLLGAARQAVERAARDDAVSFEDLHQKVEQSQLLAPVKERLHDDLETIRNQIADGARVDVQAARTAFDEISKELPTLRDALWLWLRSQQGVPTAIEIIARRVLTA